MSVCAKIRKRLGDFTLDVEFESENGTLGLLGASGCGKSLTLKCIAGVVRPDEGLITVNGRVLFDSQRKIDLKPQQRHVGLMFQNYALFPNMTLKENISSVIKYSSGCRKIGKKLEELTESLFLRGLEDHYPCQLSGGQQQRAALARILASEPQLIMLDEPLSALDSYLRWQVEQELSGALASFGGTTLYVSHNRNEVFRMCKNICVINRGRSEKVCSSEILFKAPSTLSAALLSGCRNFSRVSGTEDGMMRALDWHTVLKCREIRGDIRFVGVRSHHVVPAAEGDEGSILCRIIKTERDVFHTSVLLLPVGSDSKNELSYIRMELSNSSDVSTEEGETIRVSICGKHILPLTA